MANSVIVLAGHDHLLLFVSLENTFFKWKLGLDHLIADYLHLGFGGYLEMSLFGKTRKISSA